MAESTRRRCALQCFATLAIPLLHVPPCEFRSFHGSRVARFVSASCAFGCIISSMVTIKSAKMLQAEQNVAQERHGRTVAARLAAERAERARLETALTLNTKRTVKSHLGKAPYDIDKPEEMEALKVGKPL